jgi:hypothetical protein
MNRRFLLQLESGTLDLRLTQVLERDDLFFAGGGEGRGRQEETPHPSRPKVFIRAHDDIAFAFRYDLLFNSVTA